MSKNDFFIAEIPINRDRILSAYDDHGGKNGTARKKDKMRNFLLNYFCYRESNQIMIYIDCNRIKASFD